MKRFLFYRRPTDDGQGLVEYALLLVLVAVIVIAILAILGSTVAEVFCQVTAGLNGTTSQGTCIIISRSNFNSNNNNLQLEALVSGGYDPDITLTASPGGQMQPHPPGSPDHYRLYTTLPGTCPCDVTITASDGGSATITVGP